MAGDSDGAYAAVPTPFAPLSLNGLRANCTPTAVVRVMAKRAPAFSQSDITRALKGAAAAGFKVVERVEIDADGKIVVVILKPAAGDQNGGVNEWDRT
jgi:hypothetical protein